MGSRIYTPEIITWLRENYPKMTLKSLHAEVNERFGLRLSFTSVRAATKNHKIISGRTGRFEKGQVPPNKGVKGWCAGGRSVTTQFKPGARPQTWRPIGTRVVDSDGYRKIKVSDDRSRPSRFNWRFVHRLVWEKHHGEIPDGHSIVFIDGDRSNCDISNLDILTRAELARFNQTFAGLEHDTDLRRAAIAAAKFKSAVHAKAKKLPGKSA